MSLDINTLVRAVKQAALDAVRASGPMGVCYGTVTSTAPLTVQVDQKKTLGPAQLIPTSTVRDAAVDITVDNARKLHQIHLGLKTGEKVILLRCDGGQKYIILDRWEAGP